MTSRPEDAIQSALARRNQFTRRHVLGLMGAGAGAALLAACGGDNSGSSSGAAPTTTAASTGSTGAAGSTATTAAGGGGLPAMLKETFATGSNIGTGLTLPMDAGLLLSTSVAPLGEANTKGLELAAEEIVALGGPQFKFDIKDIAIQTTAGADAVKGWGEDDYAMCMGAGYFGYGNGIMIPQMQQYKILGFDGSGGLPPQFQNQPYAWGSRALNPADSYVGVAKFLTAALPDLRTYSIITSDLGDATTQANETLKKALAADAPNLTYVGQGLLPAGETNYNSALAEVRSQEPDVIIFFGAADSPGIFMKQYATSGLEAVVIGSDYIAHDVELAGDAMNGYYFAYDYFDAERPANEWSAHFVEAYKAKYNNETPEYAAANYYEDMYMFWVLVQRVLASGGDVNSGTALQDALISDPKFASVYGGDGPATTKTGQLAFNLETHTPSIRPMGVYKVENGIPAPQAFFSIDGSDFKLV